MLDGSIIKACISIYKLTNTNYLISKVLMQSKKGVEIRDKLNLKRTLKLLGTGVKGPPKFRIRESKGLSKCWSSGNTVSCLSTEHHVLILSF